MQNEIPQERLTRTIEFWSVVGLDRARRAHWQAHPVVFEVWTRRRRGLSAMQALATRLPPNCGRALGLGVGIAAAELELLGLGAVSGYDLFEITPQLVDVARQSALDAGLANRVTFAVVDANHVDLPADTYDVITFVSSLHHVERLEHVLGQCYSALRPGGLLYAQEYVGPNRFAFPDDHVQLARQIYRSLDPQLRCPEPDLPTPDPVAVAVADPTESIRAEEIVGICRSVFPDTDVVSEDVCLTLILWYGLNHDALYETAAGHDLVRWLVDVDQSLVRAGRLPTYHAEIFAKKPDDRPR